MVRTGRNRDQPFRLLMSEYPAMHSVSTPRSSNWTCGFPASSFHSKGFMRWHATPPEAPRHSLELLGSRQSPGLGFFVHCSGTKAPSLHRHYPASLVLRAYPSSQPALPGPRGLQVATPKGASTGGDFPCCRRTPVASMPSSMPRQTDAPLVSLGGYAMAAFPMCLLGRRLR